MVGITDHNITHCLNFLDCLEWHTHCHDSTPQGSFLEGVYAGEFFKLFIFKCLMIKGSHCFQSVRPQAVSAALHRWSPMDAGQFEGILFYSKKRNGAACNRKEKTKETMSEWRGHTFPKTMDRKKRKRGSRKQKTVIPKIGDQLWCVKHSFGPGSLRFGAEFVLVPSAPIKKTKTYFFSGPWKKPIVLFSKKDVLYIKNNGIES